MGEGGCYPCGFVLEPIVIVTEPLEAVKGLSAIAINATAIQVNWTELSLNRARGFPLYTIHIESKASPWSNDLSTQSTPAIVTRLRPATEYTVWIVVATAGSQGGGSVSSSGQSVQYGELGCGSVTIEVVHYTLFCDYSVC